MRIALAMTFVRSTVTYFNDKCLDSLTDLEELQNKQSGMKAEAENARLAYNFMKQKVTHKEDEISSLAREVQFQKRTASQFEEINGGLVSELQGIQEKRRDMQHKLVQTTHMDTRDRVIQCSLVVPNDALDNVAEEDKTQFHSIAPSTTHQSH